MHRLFRINSDRSFFLYRKLVKEISTSNKINIQVPVSGQTVDQTPIATNRHRQKRNAFPGLVKFNIGNLLLQKKARESSTSNIEEDWQKYLKVGSLYSAGKFKPNEFSNLCKLIKGNTRKINDPLKR